MWSAGVKRIPQHRIAACCNGDPVNYKLLITERYRPAKTDIGQQRDSYFILICTSHKSRLHGLRSCLHW